ncbi:MAG: uncharacterized protein A8A55_2961 [Amphiamblys sp. WSBS2006]|nr:MAG: uncharacterized protein A8A55_2961 [Amphiamblys sp. WSBS2006]
MNSVRKALGLLGVIRVCPFCVSYARLHHTNGLYLCRDCGCYFVFERKECIPVVPSGAPCSPKTSKSTGPFCARCSYNQEMKLVQERGYDPGDRDSQEKIRVFREKIDNRYPLCVTCRLVVESRLAASDQKVRSYVLQRRIRPAGTSTPHCGVFGSVGRTSPLYTDISLCPSSIPPRAKSDTPTHLLQPSQIEHPTELESMFQEISIGDAPPSPPRRHPVSALAPILVFCASAILIGTYFFNF